MIGGTLANVRGGRQSAAFVGRTGALSELAEAYAGRPVAVLVGGEAGIGKSRLVREFLAGAGIGRDEALLEEGSGLSRGALVTPDATVKLLQFMDRHRHAKAFRDTLPIAGVDGTLRRRMKATAAFDNARAKTGTLRYVNTLSGYVTTNAGERLVFSLMLNNYDGSDARADVDAMVVMLTELDTRSQP